MTTNGYDVDGFLGRPTDVMVAEIIRLLAKPKFLGQSMAQLRRVDSAFDALDGLLRSGAALPLRWPADKDTNGHESVTMLYDSVSESLREVGGPAQSFVALRRVSAE